MMDDPLICHSSTPDTVIDDNHRKEALIDNHNGKLLVLVQILKVPVSNIALIDNHNVGLLLMLLLLLVQVSTALNPLIHIKQGLGYDRHHNFSIIAP